MHNTWKWKLAGAVAAVAVAGAAPLAHAAKCGDSDNNNSIAINDVVLHLRVVSSIDPQSGLCGGAGYADCGNLNGDSAGTTDISDTVLLLRRASGIANCLADVCKTRTVLAGCPGTATLPSSITGNLVIPAGCDAHVHGLTFVEDGAVLTVDPDAIVKGDVTNPPSALVVKTGGRINAVSDDPAHPITWTSAAAPGSRQRQDWGGVNILGKAPVNQPGATLEGFDPNTPGLVYGGTDQNDFSGCMKYNRIFFSGREFTTDNELNSLTMAGVGRKTQISFVQAHFGFDDAIEWFGGTVNTNHMVATACGDDCFDTQLGTAGALQFGLIADEANSLESPGSNGFENDNSEFGASNEPFNNPKYCNVTAIGTNYSTDNPTVTNSFGILSRRGNAMTVANTIVTHWRGGGYTLRDAPTAQHACKDSTTLRTKNLFCLGGSNNDAACTVDSQCPGSQCGPIGTIKNSIFGFNTSGNAVNDNSTCPAAGSCNCSATEHFTLLQASNAVLATADASIDNIGGHVFPPTGLVPAGGSLAATHPAADCTTIDSSFVAAPYIGAFQPGGSDWTAGWTAYPFN